MLFIIVFTTILGFTPNQNQNGSLSEPQLILSSVFFDSQFEDYLHLNLDEERKKIFVIKHPNSKGLNSFEKGGIKISVADKSDIKGTNYIEINEFKINKNIASLNFYYKIENIEVQVILAKSTAWSVTQIRIIEL